MSVVVVPLVAASLSFFSSGLCAGWAAQTLVNTHTRYWEWGVHAREVPWIPATLELGALMASVPVGYAIDKYGRKYVNLTVGFLYLLSWLIVLAADMHPENLYSARVVAGLAMGATSIVVPVYVAEVAEARVRGALLTASRCAGAAGLLAMHALAPRVGYRTLVALASLPPVLFLSTFSWSPESPYALAAKERWNRATESLVSLRASAAAVKAELALLKEDERERPSWTQLHRRPGELTALLVSVALGFLAALAGQSAVVFYSALKLPESADPTLPGPDTLCLCLAGASLAGGLCCATFVDLLGRRLVLATSAAASTLSMAGLGYVFLSLARCADQRDSCGLGWWFASALLVWSFSHGLGLASLPGTLAAELAPTNLRGIVASAGAASAIVGAVLATVAFEMLPPHEACWVFASSSALCLVLAVAAVPETKGRPLAGLQRHRPGPGPGLGPGRLVPTVVITAPPRTRGDAPLVNGLAQLPPKVSGTAGTSGASPSTSGTSAAGASSPLP
ncbi:Facilitated trehalose transporter Tret1 [Frankliniella fusca]|uniref:Facilitated trehalose transporter Tret1 n=1 Tax=Frankliniella fusca TaxID=407009 RepID=A0AAE1H3N8_9NEOP|nr:Facilitated trehalose transporter Tret1 [Frankliniella fusca]